MFGFAKKAQDELFANSTEDMSNAHAVHQLYFGGF